ncbi:acyl-CoA N-acyltransferase [Gamsiella multidivaricata]|uniref:acyl-CoA N-acyltransferase n=1 Tax=Gamsiella multidivaricata TaxID=101098 RepID=UPI00221FC4FF|nr:acyl-CoA N-acyltransferase [Gamsiella multidivaricata]KAG0361415.1 hypothetical protein BGZ54_009106 [Gamsiella multidivaricata]KAI7820537.1 acyl-CoA N-acyltransferase [Gamsiella multidivaricata]
MSVDPKESPTLAREPIVRTQVVRSAATNIDTSNTSPEELERLNQIHDSYKPIWLTETIQIGPVLPSDKDALLEHLNDPRIYQWLLGPPNPYTPADADFWINSRALRMTEKGMPLNFSIRDMTRSGKVIGSIGVSNDSDDKLDGDDTGYWLASEYHGQGLMAKALKMILWKVSVMEVGKRKFNGRAFEGNWASRKTMEKVGFVLQPDIHDKRIKDNKTVNLWTLRLYLTEEDVANHVPVAEATPLPSLVQ